MVLFYRVFSLTILLLAFLLGQTATAQTAERLHCYFNGNPDFVAFNLQNKTVTVSGGYYTNFGDGGDGFKIQQKKRFSGDVTALSD